MVSNVQNYIRSLNWGYRVQLRNKEINYINALASFIDPHSIQCVDKKGVQVGFSALFFAYKHRKFTPLVVS